MQIWSAEIKELESLYTSLKGKFPELEKELERLVKADDENMVLLYSRRCLEVIISDLCKCELKRPRKTEPLKGILDKLHHEEKVPAYIITSMHGLNDLSTYGAHPKEFNLRQVRTTLIDLVTIIEWFFNYKKIEPAFAQINHIESLKVIARTSAFAFKDKHEDVRKIGREFNVETLLEGSVRKSGDKLRINAQLIKVSDGSHLWSERYDREMKDIFEIQDEISLAIVDKLRIELFEDEKKLILKSKTQNLDAYNHYLKGRYHWNKRTKEGLEKSIEYFEKSIETDPSYAPAYTGLADAYTIFAVWGFILPT